jgi:anti-sigma factor RsiW|nr:hypothetical protein [Kofleriaceae bacterium]
MLDRQDIDALLVGALYGELTPAESERLAHHLESHPADKAALADMTSARSAVRDSRILARDAMTEPPQAISALLLQEAHRRAPRPAAARELAPSEGWFGRFLKSFVSHPAMAAAAMLVLVVGTAGIIKMRHGSIGAEEKLDTASARAPSADPMAAPAVTATIGGATGEAGADAGMRGDVDLRAAAGSAGMAVSLDDATLAARDQQIAQGQAAAAPAAEPAKGRDLAADNADKDFKTAEAKPALQKAPVVGMTVRTPQPQVKDLPEDSVANPDSTSDDGAANKVTTTATFAAPPPQAPAAHGAAATGNAGGGTGGASNGVANNGPGTAPATTPAQQPPPPPPQQQQQPHTTAPNQERSKSDASLLAWADGRHKELVGYVQANDCAHAVEVALAIEQRAPDYYAQSVANDRAVQGCMSYVAQERARRAAAAQQKAQRVNGDETQQKK